MVPFWLWIRLFTNSFSGPEPPRLTCYIQSALALAFGPAVASAALSLVVTVSLPLPRDLRFRSADEHMTDVGLDPRLVR